MYFTKKNEQGLYTTRSVGEYDGFGDVKAGYEESDVVVSDSNYSYGFVRAALMKPTTCLADYSDGYLDLYFDVQQPYTARKDICGYREKYTVLATAAERTASPHIRSMGTIGGNNRCWYYRAKDNFFPCKMKGGKKCYAPAGDNRIHSIFGAVNACFAINPSDTAPSLVVLDAEIVTTDRVINAYEFWTATFENCTILQKAEIVKEIRFPACSGIKSAFLKHALRPTIDFPIINCAVKVSSDDVKICLNGVYPTPYRPIDAENIIRGKDINEEIATEASELAFANVKTLSKNAHKVQIAKIYIKRLLLACKE